MEKKVTIRDVAREAGVSVATVSYVLNNRSDQKISAETKKKVLQIANLLQFTPSYAAKILTTGKSHIIGILPGRVSRPGFSAHRFYKLSDPRTVGKGIPRHDPALFFRKRDRITPKY